MVIFYLVPLIGHYRNSTKFQYGCTGLTPLSLSALKLFAVLNHGSVSVLGDSNLRTAV